MALTHVLKQDEELKTLIKKTMPSKAHFFSNTQEKAFSKKNTILAPYFLENPGQAALVGNATDYVFRFVVAKHLKNNKEELYKRIVAENGLSSLAQKADYPKYEEKFYTYLEYIKKYVDGNESYFNFVLEASVFFSNLEQVYRRRLTEIDELSFLDKTNPILLKDINNVVQIFINVFIKGGILNPDSDVVFNPHFGNCGLKCGGADADLYIDGILYDFKCTKEVGYHWDQVGQVYAYYLLNLLCKEDSDRDAKLIDKDIKGIAIYHSRYGLINSCILAESDKKDSDETLISFRRILDRIEIKNNNQFMSFLELYAETYFENQKTSRKEIAQKNITPKEFPFKVGDMFDGGWLVGKGKVLKFVKRDVEWEVIVDLENTGKVIAKLSHGMRWKKIYR